MYPVDHHFIFSDFSDFQKHFSTIFIRIQEKPKHTVCSPKKWMNTSTALGHKFVRRHSVEQTTGAPSIIAFPDQLRAAAIDITTWLLCLGWCVYVAVLFT